MSVTVQSDAQLASLLDVIGMYLADFDTFWPRLEALLPDAQRRFWNGRYGLAEATIEARRRGLGVPIREARRRRQFAGPAGSYYERNRPNAEGVRPEGPKYVWTRSLQRATQAFTLKERARAAIDTAKSYRGPLRGMADPVSEILGREPAWDERALDRLIEGQLEDWALGQAEKATRVL